MGTQAGSGPSPAYMNFVLLEDGGTRHPVIMMAKTARATTSQLRDRERNFISSSPSDAANLRSLLHGPSKLSRVECASIVQGRARATLHYRGRGAVLCARISAACTRSSTT